VDGDEQSKGRRREIEEKGEIREIGEEVHGCAGWGSASIIKGAEDKARP